MLPVEEADAVQRDFCLAEPFRQSIERRDVARLAVLPRSVLRWDWPGWRSPKPRDPSALRTRPGSSRRGNHDRQARENDARKAVCDGRHPTPRRAAVRPATMQATCHAGDTVDRMLSATVTARRMLRGVLALAVLAACTPGPSTEAPSMSDSMTITSSAFEDGGSIPGRYTCDADDVSPPLAWSGAPAGTAAFALIVDDPDARGWIHWVGGGHPDRPSVDRRGRVTRHRWSQRLRSHRLGRPMPAIGNSSVCLRDLRARRTARAARRVLGR